MSTSVALTITSKKRKRDINDEKDDESLREMQKRKLLNGELDFVETAKYDKITHKINQSTHYFEPHLIKYNEITAGITRSEYEERRNKLFYKLGIDSCLILASNSECKFSGDGRYNYRQDADFNYFTGLQEAYSIAIFTKDAARNCQFILFVQPRIENEITWNGHRCGLNAAIKYFGAHQAFEYERDRKKLYELMVSHNIVYFDESVNSEISEDLQYLMKTECKKKKIRLCKSRKMLQEIRLIKSSAEIKLLRKSTEISSLSMIDTLKFCESGMLENELCVHFENGCKIRGAQRLSFQCSVASGLNAINLAYFNNNSILNSGDLLIIDGGCEYNGYSSDIARTVPINGKFNVEQKKLYEMMLSVSNELISMMIIGCTIKKLEDKTLKLIKNGLKKLKIINKLKNHQIKELKLLCCHVHFVSHFIGLDIHDTSDISQNKQFKQNMVLAIEPAIYLPHHPLIPQKYRNIAIRIEDDVLITNDKPEILSKALPRTVQQIEQCMAKKSMFQRIRPFTLLTDDNDNNNNSNNRPSKVERDEIKAAKILSSIGFVAKKEEKKKEESISKQHDWFKLIQQAIHENEEKVDYHKVNEKYIELQTLHESMKKELQQKLKGFTQRNETLSTENNSLKQMYHSKTKHLNEQLLSMNGRLNDYTQKNEEFRKNMHGLQQKLDLFECKPFRLKTLNLEQLHHLKHGMQNKIKKIDETERQLIDNTYKCVACMDRPKNMAFLDGCNHIVLCHQCESKLVTKTCPLCKTPYTNVRKMNF